MSVHRTRHRRTAILFTTLTATAIVASACSGAATQGSSSTADSAPAATAMPATHTSAPASSAGGDQGGTAVEQAQALIGTLEQPISTWPQVAPLATPANMAGKKITLVPFIEEVPIMHGTGQGFIDALEQLGAQVDVCDGAGDPTKVASCLTTAGERGVDAVVTLFIDYDAIGNAVESLMKQGIPVLIGGMPPSANRPADDLLGYADHSPFTNAGYEYLANAALAAGGPNASVIAGRLRDSSLTTEFSDTMVNTFKELCPTCQISTFDFTAPTVSGVASSVSAGIAAQPDTNIVVMPDDGFATAALQGIQSAGFGDKVQIVSYGGDPAGLERVKAGQQAASIGFPVEFEGWRLANSLLQLLGGEEVTAITEPATRAFTANNVGELDIRPENYFTSAWYGDDSFKQDFLTAWGSPTP